MSRAAAPVRPAGLAGLCLLLTCLGAPVRAAETPVQLSAPEATGERVSELTFRSSTAVVRTRQHNPLRAARIFSYLRVAQWRALQTPAGAAADAPAQAALLDISLARTAAWLLPQEAQGAWQTTSLRAQQGLANVAQQTALQDAAESVSAALLQRSLTDGADARRRPLAKPTWQPGVWARTPPLFAEQPTEPQAPQWTPWCAGTEALQPEPPPAYGSARWIADMREVMTVRAALTPAQKESAERWNLDAGSITPPGVWNAVALDHLQQHPRPPAQRAELLARLNMAMHDALVAAWRIKVQYWGERPITAIQREWQPDFQPWLVTPPFPGYVSGHSTVSGAAAAVLTFYAPEAAPRWRALAEEASMSRLWGGIHPRYDNDAGLELGQQVGRLCLPQRPSSPPAAGGIAAAAQGTSQ
ncbi:vanadium-dependent haloperoxidase [Roseateles sp. DAIF2]|uniref:vanadium-dependent haloperoxidase n=1 Tax=Roseateles sp. DAIF2 TaxID=2714952 RepID=UPI0018A32841|nr:vanadium-dependent haloperoxidase [Roseateles sp. DAIF2]QPF71609.1 vanadium-dependent haloperoxidase [Roseateles sp. DAIF2]